MHVTTKAEGFGRYLLALVGLAIFLCAGVATAAPAQQEDKSAAPDQAEGKAEKKEQTLPLKPTRKITFTTDEGTWVSLDVSPDGKQIVFDLLGDLYAVPTSGGEALRLTSGLPWDCQPRFSPDGKQIAFISDRNGSDNLWIMNADGTNPKRVSDETDYLLGSPAWAPDGNYIVARRYGPYPGPDDYLRMTGLWMYHKDGGKGVEVVKGKGETQISSGAAFSPDGKLIYFSSHRDQFRYNADIGRFQVYTFNRDTGEVEKLTSEYGGGLRPIVSPDGRWLVYASRHDAKTGLRIRDLTTRDEHWLALPIQRDDQEGFAVNDLLPGYSFTPDSKAVVFTHDGHIQRVDLATRKVATIPFSAKVELDLGPRIHTDYAIDDGPLTVHQDALDEPVARRKTGGVQRRRKNLGKRASRRQAAPAHHSLAARVRAHVLAGRQVDRVHHVVGCRRRAALENSVRGRRGHQAQRSCRVLFVSAVVA